jgi:hypothetical protein
MFSWEEDALAFMERCRAELRRNRGALLVSDAEVYWDCVRAREVLRGVPGTSLELAAHLLVLCKSPKEMRGGSFQAPEPAKRTVTFEPRVWFGVEEAAKREGCKATQLVERLLWKFLEGEAEKMRKEERKLEKEFCWWDEDGGGVWVGMRGERPRTRTRRGGAKKR